MPAEARPTIGARLRMSDLAELAGVSISTVSRALADSPQIPADTRAEIVKLAEAHGYIANVGARRLRLNRTEIIAVAIPLGHEQGQPVSDPFFLELVGHLADEVSARGYDVLLTRTPAPEPGWLGRLMRSGRADGLIVVGQSDQHEALNAAGAGAAPLVVWGAQRPAQTYCTVGVDNAAGARAATEHLLARGRRRIAFFGRAPVPEVEERFRGYREALADAGASASSERVLSTHLLADLAEDEIRKRLAQGVDFDAVVCATDVIAAAAIAVLQEKGLSIPADVMVTGFDDVALAAANHPPLTTVRQDLSLGARTIVDLLFRRLGGEATPSVVMPAPLIVRRSTTP